MHRSRSSSAVGCDHRPRQRSKEASSIRRKKSKSWETDRYQRRSQPIFEEQVNTRANQKVVTGPRLGSPELMSDLPIPSMSSLQLTSSRLRLGSSHSSL
jgi:hypothetical protein